jgi:hypothetical protein
LDLALAYEKLFDDNRVMILKMKTHQIGFFSSMHLLFNLTNYLVLLKWILGPIGAQAIC